MSYLPLLALMMVPRQRRNSLLPVALPAMATNLPVAQLGALAVVTSDSAVRREHNTATAAVAETIAVAVDKGATLTADDFKTNPIALDIVKKNPNILEKAEVGELTQAQSDAIVQKVIAAMKNVDKNTSDSPTANQPG